LHCCRCNRAKYPHPARFIPLAERRRIPRSRASADRADVLCAAEGSRAISIALMGSRCRFAALEGRDNGAG
jgi:hypothetical protein